MNHAAEDGGGGAPSSLVVDPGTLTQVAARLGTAAGDLDAAGSTRPSAGGTGQAEPLLLMILAAASEAAGRLSFESSRLAAAVEDCNVAVQTADSQAAASFLVDGGTP
ncbi:hypothetical protein NPS01_29260 [Nocardioides psychrotolerans]|uniref:Excreted virulence factor EspC, type VII ESX diderm n=1 Tax=Nocardioides psychrotolerans TaxID=1005945 RepID=A0A1I3DW29_9ACTN|nr:hypothetical protein [Nocardioides psychrotolerans]GEP39263.1 hypothetical protein NPS01_29260 [Nocardioides psychrotolerans]SFH90843.1 hypothetical protein SAMN05216561_103107 [Nocardioides psychrotolerans]